MTSDWRPDVFLDGYDSLPIHLSTDPDGQDPISATLVRPHAQPDSPRGAVLYVHGFTDYFFQTEMADFFTSRGYAFYALDLRKCGRSTAAHHQPHYVSDLAFYDEELGRALDVIDDETSGAQVLVVAHSTGGLVTPLWLNRLREADPARHARVSGLLLNSPWLDLQGDRVLRTPVATGLITAVGSLQGTRTLPRSLSTAYGDSLHADVHGEWTYDLVRKPLGGFPITFGWLSAIRAGHREVHRGIDVGVPTLVLRSDKSVVCEEYDETVDTADCVLDVRQIAQWSGCLSRRVLTVAVTDARHDVFLSIPPVRERAYAEVDDWMEREL